MQAGEGASMDGKNLDRRKKRNRKDRRKALRGTQKRTADVRKSKSDRRKSAIVEATRLQVENRRALPSLGSKLRVPYSPLH